MKEDGRGSRCRGGGGGGGGGKGQGVGLTSESIISLCPMIPTCIQLNFLRTATRALLHPASDGIVRKNKGYLSFFVKVGDVDPYDTCMRNIQF